MYNCSPLKHHVYFQQSDLGQDFYIPRGKQFLRAFRVGFNVPIKKQGLIHSLHSEKECLKRELYEENITLLKFLLAQYWLLN